MNHLILGWLLLSTSLALATPPKVICLLQFGTLVRRGGSPREAGQIKSMKGTALFLVETNFQRLRADPGSVGVSDAFLLNHARDLVRRTLKSHQAERLYDEVIADIDAKGGHAKALAAAKAQKEAKK